MPGLDEWVRIPMTGEGRRSTLDAVGSTCLEAANLNHSMQGEPSHLKSPPASGTPLELHNFWESTVAIAPPDKQKIMSEQYDHDAHLDAVAIQQWRDKK